MSVFPSAIVLLLVLWPSACVGDETTTLQDRAQEIQRGSQTAKAGFQNEDEIRDKFNNWKNDEDAQAWLGAMKYSIVDLVEVSASKPHGNKADVEVRVKTTGGEKVEGISIKLVSNPDGFNQIDKRWLATYATMWNMPDDVHQPLKLFVGEIPPVKPSRDDRRMFLNELDEKAQQSVLRFFAQHRDEIVSNLFSGDGEHAAGWMMVTLKNGSRLSEQETADPSAIDVQKFKRPQWILRSTEDVIRFYSEGEISITPSGSLRIGRITMQRKGGDNGRETAKMLQFKINPADLFELETRTTN